MAQSEILNYDPSRYQDQASEFVEVKKVSFYTKDNTFILALSLPASELTGKIDEEICRYVLRAFLAFNVDVSKGISFIEGNVEVITATATQFARIYTPI